MTQGAFMLFKSKKDVEDKVHNLVDSLEEWDFSVPVSVKLEPYRNPRSLDQNAMSHVWYKRIAKHMEKKGCTIDHKTPDIVWKLWLKKRFLGEEIIKIGKQEVINVARTSKLSKGDMCHYLDQVWHWARDQGIKLPIQKDSEYAQLLDQQDK